mmetsp:Transcript_82686/g.129196  ORF Transcript_82686/g.129196 Transcript_82686/m.129196 type:complete len:865 (-) Transcript_82686:307-2901(-)
MGCCVQPAGKAVIMKDGKVGKKDFREKYDTGKKLGEGTFGMVFECTDKVTKATYAVKMLEHQSTWWGNMSRSTAVQWEMFAQEFEMLRTMNHPNVIKMVDTFADNHFLYFVMDKYENSLIGAVLPCLQKGKKSMPNACLGEITAQMCRSIVYLHGMNIVHRDVKADNYLVDGNTFKGRQFKVVLTDLSTARHLEDGVFLKEMLGTMQYWAPEIVARYYTHKVDCWAIGVILWCMLTMKFPFNTVQETYTKKLTMRADKMTAEQFDLVQNLLEKNPAKRFSAQQALEHQFVADSILKHKQMCEKKGASQDDEGDTTTGADDKGDDGALGFGDAKKAVDQEAKDRRQRNLKEAQEAYNRGEGGGQNFDDFVKGEQAKENSADAEGDLVAKDKQRRGEAKTYSWWSITRCKQKDVKDVNTSCDVFGKIDEEDPASEQTGDIALTEPSSVEDLRTELKHFKVDTSNFGSGQAKSLENLLHELQSLECRLMLRNKKVIRVVDLLLLRLRTPNGKILIEESQTFKDGRSREVKRLPGVMRQAGGSGVETARSEIDRLLANELGTTSEVIKVNLQLFDPTQEITSKVESSQSYPGLESVYRKTFFEAVVNTKADKGKLQKLGLMDEKSFTTNISPDGTTSSWQYYTDDQIKKSSIDVSAKKKSLAEFEGFTPLSMDWTVETMTSTLAKHGVDTKKFGQGGARSIKELVDETKTGETRLYSKGSEIRRYLDILIVKIRRTDSGTDSYLIETGHSFGKGQSVSKNAFPATKIRPYEDKLWAVRRLLGEVDIPYASSKIQFGPRRTETSQSPSYPGLTTVYLKQVVEVTLSEINVADLTGADLGAARWFAHGHVDNDKVRKQASLFQKEKKGNQ